VFVEAYVDCLNATEAARRAGYAHPNVEGPKNLVKPSIRAALDVALRARTMPKDEVLARLTAIATADMRELMRFRDEDLIHEGKVIEKAGSFVGLRLHRDAPLHLIKSITPTKYGDKIELHDPITPLLKIGEAYGIFRDRIADGLDAIAAAARSLDTKLMADVEPGAASGIPGESDRPGEGGTQS
jgi:hypothetical protein